MVAREYYYEAYERELMSIEDAEKHKEYSILEPAYKLDSRISKPPCGYEADEISPISWNICCINSWYDKVIVEEVPEYYKITHEDIIDMYYKDDDLSYEKEDYRIICKYKRPYQQGMVPSGDIALVNKTSEKYNVLYLNCMFRYRDRHCSDCGRRDCSPICDGYYTYEDMLARTTMILSVKNEIHLSMMFFGILSNEMRYIRNTYMWRDYVKKMIVIWKPLLKKVVSRLLENIDEGCLYHIVEFLC